VVGGDYWLSTALDKVNETFAADRSWTSPDTLPAVALSDDSRVCGATHEFEARQAVGRQASSSLRPARSRRPLPSTNAGTKSPLFLSHQSGVSLGETMSKALALPELQAALKDLGLAYGEI
jgi:hypothetical protein